MKSKAEIEAIERKWRAEKEYESQGREREEAERANKKYEKKMERDYDDNDDDDNEYYKDLDNKAFFNESSLLLRDRDPSKV